jgi:two-component system nitrogen regulation sensor histidine kinase GlnL
MGPWQKNPETGRVQTFDSPVHCPHAHWYTRKIPEAGKSGRQYTPTGKYCRRILLRLRGKRACLKGFIGNPRLVNYQRMSHRVSAHGAEVIESSSVASILHDCLGSGVVVVGEDEQVLTCTPEAERLLQISIGEKTGLTLAAMPVAVQKIAREAAATRSPIPSRVVMVGTGKHAPTLRVAALPYAAGDGKFQVIVTLNDIAMVRRIEQNIHRLDRLASAGTLAAGMAHEIKNAFVAVKTFVDLLLEKNRDAELAEVVGREMKRIDSIVCQMLRFGAPARPSFAAVRVHEVLDYSLRMLQHQFEGKLISLNREFKAPTDSIQGDDYQLEQAFLNLFLNSLDAMGPNGSLTVATDVVPGRNGTPNASSFCVSVVDNGIGIQPENMRRLYEPFFTTKQNGTGLGLAIVRRIVREHQGDVSIESQPNKGTIVKILLPTGRPEVASLKAGK